jgi:hypothetical protein
MIGLQLIQQKHVTFIIVDKARAVFTMDTSSIRYTQEGKTMNKRMLKKRDKILTLKFFLAWKKKFPVAFKDYKNFGDFEPSQIYRKRNW